ncbi:MAG: 50S ribosomal protein L29 [Caldiserica bacterium]|nr:50S ribosomal protein L29 [Caldisericota bacterium]
MKARELRELSDDELRQKVAEWKRKLLNLRFQLASGQLQNTAEIKKTKRDIARALTILRERELQRQREGSRA